MELINLKVRNKLYILVICLYLSFYFAFISTDVNRFNDAIEKAGHPGLTLLPIVVFDIISVIWHFVIALTITAIFAYFFRQLPIVIYIVFPFILKFISFFVIVYFANGLVDLLKDYKLIIPDILADTWSTIFIFLIILGMGLGGYVGYKIMFKHGYIEQIDAEKFYFYGIPKRQWVAILLVMTPVLRFINEITNVII